MTLDIVIATRDRPEALRRCLNSVNAQTLLPNQVVVVDSSESLTVQNLVQSLSGSLSYPCVYRRALTASAARQRNTGAAECLADLLLFLDDDAFMESDCVSEMHRVFEAHHNERLAGVSATISNGSYVRPGRVNRFLLGLCLGKLKGSLAGRVIGPAVNFSAADGPPAIHEVEWLPTTCVAYRRQVFEAERFEETFSGYSFAEDLHLSTRIARNYKLVTSTRARAFHADLGKDTHRDWAALGESQVRNRWLIMTSILGRSRFIDNARLFAYEMLYVPVAWLAAGANPEKLSRLTRLLQGKLRGFRKVWSSTNPSRPIHD